MIPIILAVVFGALGVFILVNPKAATKKENREDEAAVKKVKKMGVAYLIIGVIVLATGLLTWEKEVNCSGCGQPTEVIWYNEGERNFCDRCYSQLSSLFR